MGQAAWISSVLIEGMWLSAHIPGWKLPLKYFENKKVQRGCSSHWTPSTCPELMPLGKNKKWVCYCNKDERSLFWAPLHNNDQVNSPKRDSRLLPAEECSLFFLHLSQLFKAKLSFTLRTQWATCKHWINCAGGPFSGSIIQNCQHYLLC